MRLVTLLATTAASALLATAVLAQGTPAAPAYPAGTAQDEVNNTTQPPLNPDGTVPTGQATVTTTTTTSTPMDSTRPMAPASAPTATSSGTNASATESANVQVVTNGPVPDTPENRAKYGGPRSHAGKRTAARGN